MGCPLKCRENQAKTRHKFNQRRSFVICGFCKTVVYKKFTSNLSTFSQPKLSFSSSFPAGMLPETFEVGKGSALRPVGDPRPGRLSPIMLCWAKPFAGAGGPWIASIAYELPKTRVPRTARLSPLSTARRICGRGNGEARCRTTHHSHAADMKTATLGLPFLINAREYCGIARGRWCRCLP